MKHPAKPPWSVISYSPELPTLERSVVRLPESLPTVAVGGPRWEVGGLGFICLSLLTRVIGRPLPNARLPPPRALPQLHRQAQNTLQGN